MNLIKLNHSPFAQVLDHFLANTYPTTEESTSSYVYKPATNVLEKETYYQLELVVPGVDKQDLKINLENEILTVSSETKVENNSDTDTLKRREFTYRAYKRSFNLPENVDTEAISADYKNGILYVNLPKKAEAQPIKKEISIQ